MGHHTSGHTSCEGEQQRSTVFHFHSANIFHMERREKRDDCIAKSDCSKRSRHGESFNSRDGFAIFDPIAVGLICRTCAEFRVCVQNDHCKKFSCAFNSRGAPHRSQCIVPSVCCALTRHHDLTTGGAQLILKAFQQNSWRRQFVLTLTSHQRLLLPLE